MSKVETKRDQYDDRAAKLLPCSRAKRRGLLECDEACDVCDNRPDVADALREQAREIERLQADVKTFKACWDKACHDIAELDRRLEAARAILDEICRASNPSCAQGHGKYCDCTGEKAREWLARPRRGEE